MGTGYWGLGNSGPPLGIRGNGDWEMRGMRKMREMREQGCRGE
ncbi:hypothetical protein FDUTEX481_05794 [Tolypothrix sp. PCC 7601]|nr:hypothetical protein FDUTEX481_05794 [Tolypothrix sp. PCC 7601]